MAQWREGGRIVPDTPWQRHDHDFGAMLLLTKKPEAFLDQWDRPSSPSYKPNISDTNEAVRGDLVAVFILFVNCAANPEGTCGAEVDYRVVKPDGSTYAEHKGATVWRSPPPPANSLQVAQDQLYMKVEPEDPLGAYRVEATVRDTVTGREVHLIQPLRVGPPETR